MGILNNDIKVRAGLYMRVSTEDQAREGFSLPEQKERLEAYCKLNNFEIVDYYEDAGISAKKGNYRPEWERLKEDIKSKKINTMIALKQDRITRSIYDWENILSFLEENEAYLDFVYDDINTTTSNGRMISHIMMSVSQNEIERNSERTKVGLAGAIKQYTFHIKHHLVINMYIKCLCLMNQLKILLLEFLICIIMDYHIKKLLIYLKKKKF